MNKAKRLVDGQQFALKSILKSSLKEKILKDLLHSELNTLATTAHPNIVEVKTILHDDINYYVVSELVEGG